VRDRYVNAANPDDSGSLSYRRTTGAAGVVWAARPGLRVYASAGEGFETPTFSELAYRNGASGPNLALRPATSRQVEAGLKRRLGAEGELNAAVFAIATRDEIVADVSSGGRTTFRNAARTDRRGAEFAARGRLGGAWEGAVAATWIDATFRDGFGAGATASMVPAGSFLPGVARASGWLDLSYRFRDNLRVGAEARAASRVYVNDVNSDAAPGYAVASIFAAGDWRFGPWRVKPYLRVDNLFGQRHVGSVIVAEARGRYFEPAPGRTWSAGVSLSGVGSR
jgi:iron complex outermembrane receptor protein